MIQNQDPMNKETRISHDPYRIFRFSDVDLDYEAVLVIDTLRGGRSSGGIRISDHIDEDEIQAMAHSMSMKYRILHRQMGGRNVVFVFQKTVDLNRNKTSSNHLETMHLISFKIRCISPIWI